MMDIYVYRGKRIDNGEWVRGFAQPFGMYGLLDGIHCKNECGGHQTVKIDPDTLGQCTWKRDQNGLLIYEGDVLDYYGTLLVVEWRKDCWRAWEIHENGIYGLNARLSDYYAITPPKIIGNIHDNPELLEAGNG